MRVLVFEQWRGGHYYNYLSALVPKISQVAGEVVLATCGNAIASNRFQQDLKHLLQLPNLTVDGQVPEENPALPARSRVKLLVNLVEAVQRAKPDFLLVPSGDAQTLALGLIAPFVGKLSLAVPSETILHYGAGPSVVSRADRIKEYIYRRSFAGSSWRKMRFVNCLQYECFRSVPWRDRVGMIPDPLPSVERLSRQVARSLLGLPESGRMLGFVGIMDHRKAIPELITAFRAAALGFSDRLLLAGEIYPSLVRLIEEQYADLRASGRLILLNRWLSERELMAGYSALDLVCLPYYDFPGLSSLMLKAVALHRPVLVHDRGWMRAMVRRFELGAFVDIHKTAAFATAMREALDRSMDYQPNAATLKLIEYHDQDNFAEHAVEGLRNLAALPCNHSLLRWEDVLEQLPPERRMLQ